MTARNDGYLPIDEYALLGDGHGTALAGSDGRIDWLAVPNIDSPPFLAAVLDTDHGGFFSLAPVAPHTVRRRYEAGTMVLRTEFETDSGVVRVTDALTQGFQGRLPWSELARLVEVEGGPVGLRWELKAGSRLSTTRPWVHDRHGTPFVLSGDLLAALVHEHMGSPVTGGGRVHGKVELQPGQPALLALVLAEGKPLRLPEPADVRTRMDHTLRGWKEWSGLIRYDGPHRDDVVRSALTIKALSSADSGALVAAPTTSLPEVIGGSKNFDYRFAWVRDASFMIDSLTRLGLSEEVDASLGWLLRAVQRTAPDVHVFYALDGQPASGDEGQPELMEGYRSSDPVMIGNQAALQTQHGSYGDLFGAVARYVKRGGRLDTETGLTLTKLADRLCDEWPKPDAGLWELTDYQRYTSSMINSWNALDCAIQLADAGEMPDFHVERWRLEREAVHRFVDERCWSEAKQSLTFYAGTEDLDAAVLLAARCGFYPPDDPRLWTTIDAVRRELTADGPWLYRYSEASKEENAFVACTFWLVEALAIAGRGEEASSLLEGALAGATDLGLWGEEFDAAAGAHRGNFPIGISHLAVINAVTSVAVGRREERDH